MSEEWMFTTLREHFATHAILPTTDVMKLFHQRKKGKGMPSADIHRFMQKCVDQKFVERVEGTNEKYYRRRNTLILKHKTCTDVFLPPSSKYYSIESQVPASLLTRDMPPSLTGDLQSLHLDRNDPLPVRPPPMVQKKTEDLQSLHLDRNDPLPVRSPPMVQPTKKPVCPTRQRQSSLPSTTENKPQSPLSTGSIVPTQQERSLFQATIRRELLNHEVQGKFRDILRFQAIVHILLERETSTEAFHAVCHAFGGHPPDVLQVRIQVEVLNHAVQLVECDKRSEPVSDRAYEMTLRFLVHCAMLESS